MQESDKRARLLSAMSIALLAQTTAVSSTQVVDANARLYKCKEPSCSRNGYAGGYCNAHYIRNQKGSDMTVPLRARKRSDNCDECGKVTGAKGGWGLCPAHYKKKRYNVLKDALIAAFGNRCEVCLTSYSRSVYDFHHFGMKTDAPATIIGSKSLEAIATELAQCSLLCANCHRMEHNEH